MLRENSTFDFNYFSGGLPTELGAEHVGIIQSLISTCKLHDIDPSVYLTDVLQRVSQYPAKDCMDLTPRVWKEKFGANPLRSSLL
jgi:hypothetical protein